MPRSCHRIERQNGSGPPPEFPLASSSPGIVHCLSGRMRTAAATLRVSLRSASRIPSVRLAVHMHSLVRVSRRGQSIGFPAGNFTLSLPFRGTRRLSLAILVCYRSSAIFSLGWSLPPHSPCITKQGYSPMLASLRGSHPLWPCFPGRFACGHHNSALPITIWACSCSLAATGEILVSFFSSL